MSWLADRLDEITAQINPRDGGRTAATVRANRPPKPPAVTVSRNTPMNNPVTRGLSRGFDQLNPLDSGRTWKQRTPLDKGSAMRQFTHNAATNVAGDIVKPIPRFAVNFSTASANVANRIQGRELVTPQEKFKDPFTSKVTKVSGATGRNRELFGDAANIGLSAFAPGSSKLLQQGITRVLPKATPKIIPSTLATGIVGAPTGAASNVATYVSGNEPITRTGLVKSAKEGAIAGAATGAAIPVAGAAARAGMRRAAPAVTRGVEGAKQAKREFDIRTTPKIMNLHPNERYTLSDYADYVSGRYQPKNGAVLNQLQQEARAVAKKAGVDITSGSPAARMQRIAQFLDSYDRQANAVRQGGYIALPSGAKNTAKTGTEVASEEAVLEAQQAAPPMKPPTRILALPAGNMQRPPQSAMAITPPGKKTRYASKTVPESEYVSDQVSKDVRAGAPVYDVQTEKARYTSSLSRLKEQGDDAFSKDVTARLEAPKGKISSQDVADAQTLAQVLDARGDTASLQKATELYEKLSEHLTAAGQTVQAAAILSKRTPEGLRYWATKQLKQAGIELTPGMEQQLKTLTDAVRKTAPQVGKAVKTLPKGERERAVFKLTKFVNDQIPATAGDKIINFWRAGLLTAPTTTAGNLLGNTGEAAVRKGFVNPVATAADTVMSLFTGKRTQSLASPGAATQGFKEGTKTVPEYLKTGYDPRNLGTKYEQSRDINYGDGPLGKGLGTYVNGVYRLMGVADAPFNTAASREALSSIANAEAINKGLRGEAKAKFVKEFMASPPESAVNRAAQEGDFATFKNPTLLGKAAAGAKRPLGAVVDFIIPFTQVPAAIATRLVQRTPIGIAAEVVKQIRNVKAGGTFDQRAMAQAIGNGTFGPVVMGAGYTLAKQGQLTFGYPADAKERALWEAEGKQPYSIKMGNRWYSLNYVQPFGMLLAIGGQAQQDVADGKNPTEVTTKALATAGQAIQEQSFLKGINGILTAISDPERSAQKWMENTASSVVPNFIRSGARAADEVQRKPETVIDGVKSGVPGLRGQTPVKNDLFGNPLPAKDNFANQYLNPLKPSIDRSDDPLLQEARRLQEADLGAIPSQINKDALGKDNPLSKSQIRELQAQVGTRVNEAWQQLTSTEEYKQLTDEEKSVALKSLSSDVLAVTKREYAAKNQLGEYSPNFTGKATKLSTRQSAIQNGNLDPVSYARGETANKTTLKGDTRGTALLDKVGALNKEQRAEWEARSLDKEDGDIYTRANQVRFEGLPELPKNNKTLSLYADLLKKRSGKMTPLAENKAKLQFLKEAYKTDLPAEAREILSASTTDILNSVDSGYITVDQIRQAVEYDNLLVSKGLNETPDIPNKVREQLGLGTVSRPSGSGGSQRKSYDLYGTTSNLGTNKSLRQLLKQAVVRRG